MAGRIVVFGATGYTGELVARALVRDGRRPVLAARSLERLDPLAAELGSLDVQVADVTRPESVRDLVEAGDVLVSTVGPFVRWGGAAAEAVIAAGAHYVDSTGEPTFIRRVFDDYGPRADRAGCAMVTAFGFDWVPGNLAGALALRAAGPAAVSVDIGYFTLGTEISGGTAASSAGALLDRSFAFRHGRLQTERTGARVRTFQLEGGKRWRGVSVGGSEHLELPVLHPSLRDVDVMLGRSGPAVSAVPLVTGVVAAVTRVPGVRTGLRSLVERQVHGSTGGPDAEARRLGSSVIVAEARSASGELLRRVRLDGPNAYTFTGDIIAWGAAALSRGDASRSGALGPVRAFGLDELADACARAGLVQS